MVISLISILKALFKLHHACLDFSLTETYIIHSPINCHPFFVSFFPWWLLLYDMIFLSIYLLYPTVQMSLTVAGCVFVFFTLTSPMFIKNVMIYYLGNEWSKWGNCPIALVNSCGYSVVLIDPWVIEVLIYSQRVSVRILMRVKEHPNTKQELSLYHEVLSQSKNL